MQTHPVSESHEQKQSYERKKKLIQSLIKIVQPLSHLSPKTNLLFSKKITLKIDDMYMWLSFDLPSDHYHSIGFFAWE